MAGHSKLKFKNILVCLGFVLLTAALVVTLSPKHQENLAAISDDVLLADRTAPVKYELPNVPDLQKIDPPKSEENKVVEVKDDAVPVSRKSPEEMLLAKAKVISSFQTPRNKEGGYTVFQEAVVDMKYPNVVFEESYARDDSGKDVISERIAMVSDNVLVHLRDGVPGSEIDRIAKKYAGRIVKKVGSGNTYLVKIEKSGIKALSEALRNFQNEAAKVSYAEPNFLVFAAATPNDPLQANVWGMHNTGQSGGTNDADVDAPEAWDIKNQSTEIVAVLDTGIDYLHPDLKDNMWKNPREVAGNNLDDDGNGKIDDVYGWDFFNDDSDPMDDAFHGTHCAGTIGAVGNNGQGITGIAWKVKLAALRFMGADGGYLSDAIDAIAYANLMRFKITSNSWGGGGYSQALFDEVKKVNDNNYIFIAAAGNASINSDLTPRYPGSFELDAVVSVGSTDLNDKKSYFSNYGKRNVDIFAPGEAIFSTVPSVVNDAMRTAYLTEPFYGTISGTSMAAPMVSGTVALIYATKPTITNKEAKQILLSTADINPNLSEYAASGGRLNVAKALSLAKSPLQLSSYTITDVSSSTPLSSGDGIINPAETISLNVSLTNKEKGEIEAYATIRLKEPDANITLNTNKVTFSFKGGQTRAGTPAFNFTVGPNVTKNKRIDFVLTMFGAGLAPVSQDIKLWVYEHKIISGKVSLNGQALANTTVQFTGPLPGSVKTNASGNFSFTVLPGDYSVSAVHTNGAKLTKYFNIKEAQAPEYLALPFYTVATGIVKDSASNLPIAGASVMLSAVDGVEVITDANGRYEIISGAIINKQYHIRVSKKGQYFSDYANVVFTGTSAAQNFSLKPGAFKIDPLPRDPQLGKFTVASVNDNYNWAGSQTAPTAACWYCNVSIVSVANQLIKIPSPEGKYDSAANDINNLNEVVGTFYKTDYSGAENPRHRGYYWKNNTVKILEPLPGFSASGALSINDAGEILGTSYGTDDYTRQSVATKWDKNGNAVDVTPGFGNRGAAGVHVNNLGERYMTTLKESEFPKDSLYKFSANELSKIPLAIENCAEFIGLTLKTNSNGKALISRECNFSAPFNYMDDGSILNKILLPASTNLKLLDINAKDQLVGYALYDWPSYAQYEEPLLYKANKFQFLRDSSVMSDGSSKIIRQVFSISDQGKMLVQLYDTTNGTSSLGLLKDPAAGSEPPPPPTPVPVHVANAVKISSNKNTSINLLQLLGSGFEGSTFTISQLPASGSATISGGFLNYVPSYASSGTFWIKVNVRKPDGTLVTLVVPVVVVRLPDYFARVVSDPQNLNKLTAFKVNKYGDVAGQAAPIIGGDSKGFLYMFDNKVFNIIPTSGIRSDKFTIALNDKLSIATTFLVKNVWDYSPWGQTAVISNGNVEYLAYGKEMYVRDISNSDVVVGELKDDNGQIQSFLSYPGNANNGFRTVYFFYFPGSSTTPRYSIANSMNSLGYVAGSSGVDSATTEAFVYYGETLKLGKLGGVRSIATDLNDKLDTVGNYFKAQVEGGQPVSKAFIWKNGVSTDLISDFAHIQSNATAINNNGVSVGSMELQSEGQRAFLNASGITDKLSNRVINSLGLILKSASDISETGFIVGQGTLNGADITYVLCPLEKCQDEAYESLF